MHESPDVLFTLAGGLAAALVLGFVTQRLRLSPLVGYLLAGILVGPFTPGFVAHKAVAEQFSEIGVILLLFGVGLKFDLSELLALKKLVVPGAVLQVGVATAVGALAARLGGWDWAASVVYGLAISVASTVVVLRVLSDNDALQTRAGHATVGWLVMQDIVTVFVLVVLPVVAGRGSEGPVDVGAAALGISLALLKVGALVAFTLVFGRRMIPTFLGYVAKTRSRELFTLSVLVLALGIAIGSAKLFGVSMALGAFLAGMVVGQSDFASRAASEALPMRDAFAVLFFVSMGMLLDPLAIGANLRTSGPTLAVVMLANPLAAWVLARLFGANSRTALTLALALGQIGEFSFIIAALGTSLGLLPAAATQALVITSIVSITLNPLVFRAKGPLLRRFAPAPSEREAAAERASEPGALTLVVGYGPVGRTVTRLLRENGVEPSVIELNHETVRRLRSEGVRAVYGDASQSEILDVAGIEHATSLVFTASGSPDAVIREAKRLAPDLPVLTRATYVGETAVLKRAGADVVVSEEAEVALGMTEQILSRLGATPDQLDRARDRVRHELGPGEVPSG